MHLSAAPVTVSTPAGEYRHHSPQFGGHQPKRDGSNGGGDRLHQEAWFMLCPGNNLVAPDPRAMLPELRREAWL